MNEVKTIFDYPGLKRKIIIGLITVILIVMMFPKGESIESEVTEGAIWTNDDLIAPFSFPIIKENQEYQAELKRAENSVYPVFNSIATKNSDSLKTFASYIISVIDDNLKQQLETYLNPTFLKLKSIYTIFSITKTAKRILRFQKIRSIESIFINAGHITDLVSKRGILNVESTSKFKDSIAVRKGNIDKIEPISRYYYYDHAKNETKNRLRELNLNDETTEALIEFTLHFVYPNIIYNEEATKLEIEQAINNVSKYAGIVNENERIIAKHDRITKQIKLKIESYKEAKGETIGSEGIVLQLIGKFLHISFFITILAIYLYLFRKKIFYDNTKIVLDFYNCSFCFICYISYKSYYNKSSNPIFNFCSCSINDFYNCI